MNSDKEKLVLEKLYTGVDDLYSLVIQNSEVDIGKSHLRVGVSFSMWEATDGDRPAIYFSFMDDSPYAFDKEFYIAVEKANKWSNPTACAYNRKTKVRLKDAIGLSQHEELTSIMDAINEFGDYSYLNLSAYRYAESITKLVFRLYNTRTKKMLSFICKRELTWNKKYELTVVGRVED